MKANDEGGGASLRCYLKLLRALRPTHWIKNVLVFVPAAASHRFWEADILLPSLLAALLFCVTSSAVYLLNDIRDLEADRHHPRKQRRPLVAGDVAISHALALAILLVVVGCGVAALALSPGVAGVLLFYVLLNLLYSMLLKRVPVADVLVLTSFYLLRVVGGATASGIYVSPWLFGFCFFSLLSIALCKRFTELTEANCDLDLRGRGYREADALTLRITGIAAAFSSCVVFAIYIESPAAASLYQSPIWLWGCDAVVFFYLLRLWVRAGRGEIQDDPVFEIVRDPTSWLLGALMILSLIIATVGI